MMRSVIAWSLKFRRLAVAVAAGSLVFGIVQLRHMPVDHLPEFGPTMVEVRTESLGLSVEEVEQLITVPLEQDLLNGIPFLQDIYSESVPGMSSVVMIFEPGTSILDARQVVAEKLAEAAVALPGVSAPPQMLQPLSSTSRVLTARVHSDTLSAIDMSVLARWVIGPRLLGLPGVANVSFWGWRDRQLQVLVDPERLHDAGVSLDQIVRTTGNSLWVSPLTFLEASTPGTAGFLDLPNQRIGIRHVLPIRTPEDLSQVPIEDADGDAVIVNGEPLRLADVAEVVEDHQPLIGDALFRDGSGLLLVVEKFPGASTVEVTHDVEEALQGMLPGLAGMQIDTSLFRPASYVETATDNLVGVLAIGAGLLLLALAVLFFDWRRTLTAAIAIAVSVVVAGLVLYLRDAPANLMVLTGLVMAIGIVVDDAVVDVDRFRQGLRRREEGGGAPTWRTILEASIDMRSSALSAGLIAVAAVVPVFFLDGQAGSFLPPLVVTYILAIVASMLVALTLIPGLGMMLLASAPERRESPVIGWIRRRWERGFARFTRRAGLGYAAVGVLVLVGIVTWPFLERSSSVSLKETDLLIDLEAPPGTSLPAMNEVTADAVAQIGELPGVRNVSAHVGRAINADQVVGINSGQIWVSLDPTVDREEAIESLDEVMSAYEGLSHDVLTYSEDRISDVLLTTEEDVVVRLYGADSAVLQGKAEEVRTLLERIEGIRDPTIETVPTEPNIEVEVDLEKARQVGVAPGDVRRASAILLSGLAVGNLFEEQKVFDVVVWGTPDIRRSVEDVESLLIETVDGALVRLDEVADVRVAPNPVVKRHESVSNYLDVSASVSGDPDAVVADVEAAVAGVEFPLEHNAAVRGTIVSGEDSSWQFLSIVAAAVIGIFLLLQAAFTSWRLAILAFAALSLALVGGLLAALIAGGTLTLGSIAGFLALTGLAARNVILLIKQYQRTEHTGHPFDEELVAQGTRERLSPILITAIASALALVPVLFAGDVAGLEILRPMAVVMLGGIVTSTLVALLVLPAMYLRHGHVSRPDTVTEDLLIVIPESEPASRSGLGG
jgi:Cu/Ag efflux pump CusA